MSKLIMGHVAAVLFLFQNFDFEPARLESGDVPRQPPMVQSGGEVLLELRVDLSGRVAEVSTLRSTPPFADLMVAAVEAWRFAPARAAEDDEERDSEPGPVESRVLVAGLFRPPTLYRAAMPGEPPKDVAAPSREVPFPTSMRLPVYPVDARSDRVVLVEVEVGEDGSVREAAVVHSAPGFDAAALDAARQWRFRPGEWRGRAVWCYAYLLLGFREPVTTPR